MLAHKKHFIKKKEHHDILLLSKICVKLRRIKSRVKLG